MDRKHEIEKLETGDRVWVADQEKAAIVLGVDHDARTDGYDHFVLVETDDGHEQKFNRYGERLYGKKQVLFRLNERPWPFNPGDHRKLTVTGCKINEYFAGSGYK